MKLASFAWPLMAVSLAACSATLDSDSHGRTKSAAAGDMQYGIVSGHIYGDLAAHPGDRMSDLAGLGVRFMRIEIDQQTDIAIYKQIIDTAHRYGIEVLALVQSNAIGENPLAEDIELYAQHMEAKIDSLVAAIPNLRYIEVENEPDGYDFRTLDAATDHPTRLATLMVRVYEHVLANRTSDGRPQIVGFDFSRPDDAHFADVYDNQVITNHRMWRPSVGLPDGLPVDIISIHGYGRKDLLPDDVGYSYLGTMREGMSWYFGQTFATPGPDGNTSLFNGKPVWVTELGFGWQDIGGLDRQAQAVQQGFDILAEHPEIAVAFAYDYRDDETNLGTETAGLRANSSGSYAPHPAYYTFQNIVGGTGPQTFSDVPLDYWDHDEIEAIFAHGITTGCGGTVRTGDFEFCPERPVSDQEIDTFIGRAAGGNPPPPTRSDPASRQDMGCKLGQAVHASAPYAGTFDDVGPDNPCVNEIEGLYQMQIATGWDNGDGTRSFHPDEGLTRAQMAAFLTRAYKLE